MEMGGICFLFLRHSMRLKDFDPSAPQSKLKEDKKPAQTSPTIETTICDLHYALNEDLLLK
jgi:hypothetical protein